MEVRDQIAVHFGDVAYGVDVVAQLPCLVLVHRPTVADPGDQQVCGGFKTTSGTVLCLGLREQVQSDGEQRGVTIP